MEIKEALTTYLDVDASSIGYDPIHSKKRLEDKYGSDSEVVLNEIEMFFSKYPEPNWKNETYIEYLKRVEDYTLGKYDWINLNFAKKIVNYFAFQWR